MIEVGCGVPRELLDDLAAEFDAVQSLVVPGTDLRTPSPADGWDVGASVAHLVGFDGVAAVALASPQQFEQTRRRSEVGGLAELVDSHINIRSEHSVVELRTEWADEFAALLTMLRLSRKGQQVPWFGPPMSPATIATARLMEYWAHGQDIADGLGVVREPADRVRHVCHIGFATFGFSFANRGLSVPETAPRLELRLPSGVSWSRGDADADSTISGDAHDFALVVTQRKNYLDTSLVAHGEVARKWLAIAQCFAGPPGPGRNATRSLV